MRTFNTRFTIILLLCVLLAVVWGDLPPDIQKCKSTDNDECAAKAADEVLKRYPTGSLKYGLPNFSALNLSGLTVSRSSPDSPIQINFEFINCTVYGIEYSKVIKSTGFDKELKNIFLNLVMPNLKLKGDYEMSGKLLLLPINGKGKGEVILRENNVTIRVRLEKTKMPDNKTHLKIKKIRSIAEPKQMIVNFENLFNGNPVLSQTLNDVMNENWKDVWTELQDGINQALEGIIENIVNAILQVVTLEEAYLD